VVATSHSQTAWLGRLTPIEYETIMTTTQALAAEHRCHLSVQQSRLLVTDTATRRPASFTGPIRGDPTAARKPRCASTGSFQMRNAWGIRKPTGERVIDAMQQGSAGLRELQGLLTLPMLMTIPLAPRGLASGTAAAGSQRQPGRMASMRR